MATKKRETDDEGLPASEMVRKIEERIDADRDRLSGFLNKLISAVEQVEDPLTVVGSADSVAKIAEALTRQTHLRVEVLKIIHRKSGPKKPNADEMFDEIGLPFDDDGETKEDGSN